MRVKQKDLKICGGTAVVFVWSGVGPGQQWPAALVGMPGTKRAPRLSFARRSIVCLRHRRSRVDFLYHLFASYFQLCWCKKKKKKNLMR